MVQIFEFTEYRPYLAKALDHWQGKKRGAKARLAEALECRASYLSQVLTGQAQLSLEQADKVNAFFQHSEEQSEYFLLLVSSARSGTKSLRDVFDRQIQKRQKQFQSMKHRISTKQNLSPMDQQIYYSSWHYGAVAMALTIPDLRSAQRISSRLKIPQARTIQVIDFLLRTGIAQKKNGALLPGTNWIYLGDNPELASLDHVQWRLKATQVLEHTSNSNLHYSSVATLSSADFMKIKADLISAIESARATIKDSKEEKICSLLVDFFEI